MDFSQLFLYIPGVVLFIYGTGVFRKTHIKKSEFFSGKVTKCKFHDKKVKGDKVTEPYYEVFAEFDNGKYVEKVSNTLKNEYIVGQQVLVCKTPNGSVIADHKDDYLFNPIATTLGGVILILLAFFQNEGNTGFAMISLSAFLLGSGILLIYRYFMRTKRDLVTIKATVVDVYKRQISKKTKILKGEKFTYYPIVEYELNGQKCMRKCSENASSSKEYKVGNDFVLYFDKNSGAIYEDKIKTTLLIIGVLLTVIGALAMSSSVWGILNAKI